ncbi:MAG TPA: hypothetical protein VF406_18190 [Thermodesulfobacteriota bacterium]
MPQAPVALAQLPRGGVMEPSGRYLYVPSYGSIHVLAADPRTGGLEPTGAAVETGDTAVAIAVTP